MIELIDQSNPDKLIFHCDRCGRTFAQATRAGLDLHMPGPWTPQTLSQMQKAQIPPCEPLAGARPVVAAAPEAEAQKPKRKYTKRAKEVESS